MSKRLKDGKVTGYLKCQECGHVTTTKTVPFSVVLPTRALDCGCDFHNAVAVRKEEALDALARQHVEAA